MDTLDAIFSRASAVKLERPAPSSEDLQKMLAAASRAPDHGRLRPWRFLLIHEESLSAFGDVLCAALQAREPDVPAARLVQERNKALRAPLIIVVIAAPVPNPKVPELEQIVAVAAAAENLLLAAHALGHGTFWRTGPAAYDERVKNALGVQPEHHILGFIYVGRPVTPGHVRESTGNVHAHRWLRPGESISS